MNSFLNKDGLIHFSKKIKEYINNKTNKLETDISTLGMKVESDKTELTQEIQNNKRDIIVNTQNIQSNANAIIIVDEKVDSLQQEVNNKDFGTINGDIININKVEEYVFTNLSAGEVITIPNETGKTDYMIECYTDVNPQQDIVHKVIDINDTTTDKFIYDSRFIEVSATGAKPKDTIVLNYTKTQETIDSIMYTYYVSDVIPEEVLYNLNTITSIEEA